MKGMLLSLEMMLSISAAFILVLVIIEVGNVDLTQILNSAKYEEQMQKFYYVSQQISESASSFSMDYNSTTNLAQNLSKQNNFAILIERLNESAICKTPDFCRIIEIHNLSYKMVLD